MTDHEPRLEHILEVTGLERGAFIDVFGAHWYGDVPDEAWNADEDPDGAFVGGPSTPWHLGGHGVQLMLRAFNHGVFVAEPKGTWIGHELHYRPGQQFYLSALALRGQPMKGEPSCDDVTALVVKRRRSFRRCHYCWDLTPPEHRGSDACMGCMTRHLGVVF